MTQPYATVDDVNQNGLPDVLEKTWESVFELVNRFLLADDRFGYELVAKKSNPSLEDMLLSLKVMGAILNLLDDSKLFDGSEQRRLLNAKQQIVLFERAVLALQQDDQPEYVQVVAMMKNQAGF